MPARPPAAPAAEAGDKVLLSQTTPAGEIGQPGRTIYQQPAQRLFPVGVLIACVAVILGIVFLLF
jgi:hypothetical protein